MEEVHSWLADPKSYYITPFTHETNLIPAYFFSRYCVLIQLFYSVPK
jgi:hypothetical protein